MTDTQDASTGKKTAGAFDIRMIIAMLIGLYGVVLVVTGLFATSDADLDKADGFNINLWAGLGMVVGRGSVRRLVAAAADRRRGPPTSARNAAAADAPPCATLVPCARTCSLPSRVDVTRRRRGCPS